MATAQSDLQFGGLIKCLVDRDILTESDAKAHTKEAQKKKMPIISHLVSNEIVDSKTIASLAATEFGVPFFDLNAIDSEALPINLVSEKLIRQHHALHLVKRGNKLFIAVKLCHLGFYLFILFRIFFCESGCKFGTFDDIV